MASMSGALRSWPSLVAIATLAFVACTERAKSPRGDSDTETWSVPHMSGSRLSAERAECPVIWDTIPLYSKAPNAPKSNGAVPPGGRGGRGSGRGTQTPRLAGSFVYVDPASGLGAPGPITNIPEFHDCQKFLPLGSMAGSARQRRLRDTVQYDSLFAIFAAFRLDTVVKTDPVTWASSNAAVATVSAASGVITGIAPGSVTITATSVTHPSVISAVSIIVVPGPLHPPGKVSVLPAPPIAPGQTDTLVAAISAPSTAALPAAEIYTYGPGRPSLGIGRDFSCLYLYYDDAGLLTAKMVPVVTVTTGADACFGAADPKTAIGTLLAIVRHPTSLAVPPVARWDFDPISGQQYIGIKCGDAWCEVGPHGFRPSQSFVAASGTTPGESRVLGVKGWYDQQFLAIEDASGHAIPSHILGTVIPDPDLESRDSISFVSGWVRVAYVGLDVSSATPAEINHYRSKFRFDPVPVAVPTPAPTAVASLLSGLNQLSLCYGALDAAPCHVPTPSAPLGCGPATNPSGIPIKRWWVQIKHPSGGEVMYRCVTRRGHPDLPAGLRLAATARWRWLALDETVWNYCVAGCCESDGDERSPGWPP